MKLQRFGAEEWKKRDAEDHRHICNNCIHFDKVSKYYGYCTNGWRSLRSPNETCDGGGKGNDEIGFLERRRYDGTRRGKNR